MMTHVQNSDARRTEGVGSDYEKLITYQAPTVFNFVDCPSASLDTKPHRPLTFAHSQENMPDVSGKREFTFTSSIPPRPGDLIIKRTDDGQQKSAWEIEAVDAHGVAGDGRPRWHGVIRDLHYRSTPNELQVAAILGAECNESPMHYCSGLVFVIDIIGDSQRTASNLLTERGIRVDPELLERSAAEAPGLTIQVLDPRAGSSFSEFIDEALQKRLSGNESCLLLKGTRLGVFLTASSDLTTIRTSYLQMSQG